MADAPQFVQQFSTSLYTLQNNGAAPGWVGFIYTGGSQYPPTINIPDSFNYGYYLFAPTSPTLADGAAAQVFINAIQKWLNDKFGVGIPKIFSDAACVWLPNANGPVFGPPLQTAITFSVSGGGVTSTTNNFNLPMGQQLALSVPGQVILSVIDRGLNFRLGSGGGGTITFTVSDGSSNAPTITTNAVLSFIGPYAGTLTMSGAVSRSGNPGVIAYFETGFHYLYTDNNGADQRQVFPALVTGGSLSDLLYNGAVDPLDLYNGVAPLSAPADGRYRTLFALTGQTGIASWYRNDLGNPVDLVPLNGVDGNGNPAPYCGALVLQPRAAAGSPTDRVYMTLAGDFALAADDAPPAGPQAGPPLLLLPGLFGSERFQVAGFAADKSYDRLRFQPGQPAYVPVFPFPQSSLNSPNSSLPQPRLQNKYQTAWAAVLNGPAGKSNYLAQPQGSPLYAPVLLQQADAVALLPPLPTPSAIPQPPPPQSLLLPFAPYAGLSAAGSSFPPVQIGPFESQILSSERKRLLGAVSQQRVAAMKWARRTSAAAVADTTTRQATTPQGLYAEVAVPDPNSNVAESLYHEVVLARSNAKSPATGPVDFSFVELEPQTQDLFQTNQLMAVIVNPAYLGAANPPPEGKPVPPPGVPTFNRDVVIADWRMTAAVGDSLNTTAYSNILILKYCDGSLVDRVKNPNRWIGVNDFSITGQGDPSVALAGLSSYLQDYVAAGIANANSGNTLYKNFARIVQDPNWQGFIVLRAQVDPSGFPDQIKGLTAGIDFNQFEAHHFGVTASRVTVQGTTVTMEVPSSMFGLIDYQLPAYSANVASGGNPDMPLALPTTGDFGFAVLQLQALFENAALTDFRSRIQLTINALFASPVDAAYGSIGKLSATAVVLQGSYQRQGDTAVYVFEQNVTTVFTLKSNVLPAVAFVRVVFNTLSNGDDGTIRSRFLMWGTFEFAILDVVLPDKTTRPADLLSFGQDAGDPLYGSPVGLRFSGLDVSLSSPVDAPNAVTFVFETGRLALDSGASTAREHSLYSDLALEVDAFIAGAEDKRPIDFGFLPVSVEPKLKAISGPWFGIAYKVTMGSPGALVSQAGFTSRILLAWAPTSPANDTSSAVFVGLQLPGAAPGAKLLSIQGVLKLSIDSILLRQEAVTGQELAFVLRLNNIALTFLGILKLPSSPINFFLFGDPSGSGSLGWYAAYIEQQKKSERESIAPPRRTRRLAPPANPSSSQSSITNAEERRR
jgi:hypothetical protein